MSIRTKLFFRNNRGYGIQKKGSWLGSIEFDLILSESHSLSNQVTVHNVEDGSEISDHIRNNLENGTLSGLISNFTVKTFGTTSNRAQDAFDAMVRLWKSRTLVTIYTVLAVYQNVAITSVDVDRSEGTGEAIVLNVNFQRVNTVKLKTVQIDVSVSIQDMGTDINRQSAPSADLGRQVGVPQ